MVRDLTAEAGRGLAALCTRPGDPTHPGGHLPLPLLTRGLPAEHNTDLLTHQTPPEFVTLMGHRAPGLFHEQTAPGLPPHTDVPPPHRLPLEWLDAEEQ